MIDRFLSNIHHIYLLLQGGYRHNVIERNLDNGTNEGIVSDGDEVRMIKVVVIMVRRLINQPLEIATRRRIN